MKPGISMAAFALLGALAGPPAAPGPEMSGADWSALDAVLGKGREQPGGVRRYGWPRFDLSVSVRGTKIEPALALTSWAAFVPAGAGGEAVAMGDLVLLSSEVNPVVSALQSGGLEVLAIHNHLIDEMPRLLYVHFHGRGAAADLGQALRAALKRTATSAAPPAAAAAPSAEELAAFERIQGTLGRKGTLSGRVLQVGVPRPERIEEAGHEIPPAMGMGTALNFQIEGARAVTTGDFVLLAGEVNDVVRELQSGGLDVTALHSHMLREEPRLFFLHFWGDGPPEKVAAGLKAALAKTASRP